MQHKIPDEATILSYLHRDDAQAQLAFSWLVELYSKKLYLSIRRIVRNHEFTNDILQETFLKIWKNRHQFKGDSALFSWMYRIAFNESIQFLRREKKHQQVSNLDDPIVSLQLTATNSLNATAEEISAWLLAALEQLPIKQRLVFEYRYFDELKYEEIAAITGGSVGGLKANYFHALDKVEKYLITRLNQIQDETS